ncbi:septation ring formation regulator EzrA [Neobacillus notoginsengisoli]|uniref:Septation ring formation regulator EzrA n=1 Tax=Neobacillus notoginsengisoli TaxID=1578198 RepID=A0A417YUE4_9BACI|nr:septation ring formation regulator EzrA [Neobacillus notoginsengisoli]RHW40762.1 septation ring formation regulator EzrA [Neobacillus notoginsengisoli]
MELIIGFIFLVIALFIIGYFIKRKHYKEIDKLEAWKLDIMDRPVLAEMSRVKQLNMTGQTEEMFERWRSEWDEVVTVMLPDLEEMLFDGEEYIDKYRFGKAKEVQRAIHAKLEEIEEWIKRILTELKELVGSEEKNKVEIEELRELYRESRKTLLAHRLSYGSAEKKLEQILDEAMANFKEFEERTNHGDYLQAREIVLSLRKQLEDIHLQMDRIPQLLIECQSLLPSQIAELRAGQKEMTGQGYYLEHLEIETEADKLEKELAVYMSLIEDVQIEKVEEGTINIRGRIDYLMDLLEKEVHAKHFILEKKDVSSDVLERILEANGKLKSEVSHVQVTYHLSDNELAFQRKLEKKLADLVTRFEILEEKINLNETAQTSLSTELEEIRADLEAFHTDQLNFSRKLSDLRKDEMEAKEAVRELMRKITDTTRLVSRSNIPGLPEEYTYLLEDGNESIQKVIEKLEEKPLDVNGVKQHLEIAQLTIEKLADTTKEMVENVKLAERVIQYGNRYRSKYPSVAKGLSEAEKSFRNFDYQTALEQAATSIEEIDPGAIKKIETFISND